MTDKPILGLDIIHETTEKVDLIWKKIKASQDRQKSYVDERHTDLEFSVGDMIFMKLSPLKHVVSFGVSGKLASRFVGPFPV